LNYIKEDIREYSESIIFKNSNLNIFNQFNNYVRSWEKNKQNILTIWENNIDKLPSKDTTFSTLKNILNGSQTNELLYIYHHAIEWKISNYIENINLINNGYINNSMTNYTELLDKYNSANSKQFITKLYLDNNPFFTSIDKIIELHNMYKNNDHIQKNVNESYKYIIGKDIELKNTYDLDKSVSISAKLDDLEKYNNIIKNGDFKYYLESEFHNMYNNETHKCSQGEEQLIYFLIQFYDSRTDILLIDEPVNSLSYQNHGKFINELVDNNTNKQLIIITHNSEMITHETCKNIIRFCNNNSSTTARDVKTCITSYFNDNSNQLRDLLCKYKQALFANNLLIVEGKTDKKFYENFLKVCNISGFNIICTDGCNSQLWKILLYYNINFKIVYDADHLYKKVGYSKLVKQIRNYCDNSVKTPDNNAPLLSKLKSDSYNFDNYLTQLHQIIDKYKIDYNEISDVLNDQCVDKITKFVNVVQSNNYTKEDIIDIINNTEKPTHEIAKLSSNKIYILSKEIADLEGMCQFIDNKKKWGKMPDFEIQKEILKHINESIFIDICKFVTNI